MFAEKHGPEAKADHNKLKLRSRSQHVKYLEGNTTCIWKKKSKLHLEKIPSYSGVII